jgi:flagellum-specific peptidoglycan hydrolase FlgJ/LysM repeat protein
LRKKITMKLNQKSRFGLLTLALLSVQLFTACTGTQKSKKDVPTSYNTKSAAISNTEARLLYVDLYRTIAIREMERTGIPASIKLAQGILESNSGRSELSSKYNNHFGIKCHSEWTGERFYKEDDDKDPVTGQLIKSCFRAYKAGDESFIAHSEFLRDPRKVNRYGFLFQLDPKDYVGWANGLERAGYATATDYSEKLIRIIEDMQLSKFDQMSARDVANNNPTQNNGKTNTRPDSGFDNPNSSPNIGTTNNANNSNMGVSEGRVNDTRVLKVSYPLTLEQLAGRYDVSIKKLQDYNEEIGSEGTKLLRQGSFVYLQKKRNSYSGNEKYHRVQACETMYDVSQKYGIKLSKLYRKNEMREGDQPQAGEKIILRRGLFQSFDMPALRDTFGEWKRCNMPIDTITNRPPAPPTANRPPTINNSGEFTFDIAPGGSGQPQTSSGTTYYPPATQPSSGTTYYPPTTQPSSGTTYYPNTQPSSGTTYYPSDNNNYPNTTTTYPSSGSVNYPTTDVSSAPSYPSYPSRPATQPSRPATQPSRPTTQPTRPATQPTTTTPRPTTQPSGAVQYHTVMKGDTMYGLSKRFGVTVDRLRELNGMADTNIKIGQQLRVK